MGVQVEGNQQRVLLIEDDEDVALGVQGVLQGSRRFVPVHVSTATMAREALAREHFSAVLADLSLPDGDGVELLEEIARSYPGMALLCLTGRDESHATVQALRAGAREYLTKPASAARILEALHSVIASTLTLTPEPSGPLGESPSWRRVLSQIHAVARSSRTTVLFTGEPGVGKEEAAALVHRLSPRKQGPFLAVNASCFSPSLIESELFGHEAGAFTGAQRLHRGLFEQAHQGTLFLDEIGEMPLPLQARLLRVLEGHPFRRLGGERPVQVDVRLVCATNRRLDEMIGAGTFRADLYERLRVFEVQLPPLRERPGDVALLARHFTSRLAGQLGLATGGLSPQALAALQAHPFPGNVRELRNLMERALLLAEGGMIERRHLGLAPRREAAQAGPTQGTLKQVIRDHVLRVYEANEQNVTRTAQQLGVSRLALRRRLQSYGLRPRKA